VYYEIIRQKTASLIASACAAGAASVQDDLETVSKMHDYGELIGMAFQIKDDLFDYGSKDIGKPRGIDIREKKMTLPLIHVLSESDPSEKRRILNIVKNQNTNKRKVDELIKQIRDRGGLDYAVRKMNEFKARADEILMSMPDNIYRQSLFDLSEFVINRSK